MALATTQYSRKGFSWTGATTGTIGPFPLGAGKYMFVGEAAGTSQALNIQAPSGNFTPVYSATTAAVAQVLDLPDGNYEVVTTSASAISGFLGYVKEP
jgi:hypothetical protein